MREDEFERTSAYPVVIPKICISSVPYESSKSMIDQTGDLTFPSYNGANQGKEDESSIRVVNDWKHYIWV